MHKKTFAKVIALLALVGFIFITAPGLSSAEKKGARLDFRAMMKKPFAWASSVWTWISPILDPGNRDASKISVPNTSSLKAKPLGDSISVRPSKGD
jgi:hypothetical protein